MITFSPPLPCGVHIDGERLCDEDATVGLATRDSAQPSEWRLLPICKMHASPLTGMYDVKPREKNGPAKK